MLGVPSLSPVAADDILRWNAALSRNSEEIIYYAVVNTVIVIASIFTGTDLIGVPVLWSIYMAVKYAGLLSDGFDWRDVFRQPRDRRLVDVASETMDEVGELWGRRRTSTREAKIPRGPHRPGAAGTRSGFGLPVSELGRHADAVRQAEQQQADVLRLIESLPKSDRKLVADVWTSAGARLSDPVLARGLAEIERADEPGGRRGRVTDCGFGKRANPLERAASEERVRKLAFLKRKRRAIAENVRRADDARGKLDSCVMALQGMRRDVLRLRAGNVWNSAEHITTLTERARSLAQDVDAVIYAADEVNKISRNARERSVERGRK